MEGWQLSVLQITPQQTLLSSGSLRMQTRKKSLTKKSYEIPKVKLDRMYSSQYADCGLLATFFRKASRPGPPGRPALPPK